MAKLTPKQLEAKLRFAGEAMPPMTRRRDEHDDLFSHWRTMLAACNLVQKFAPKATYVNFIIELIDLKDRAIFPENVGVTSLLCLDGE